MRHLIESGRALLEQAQGKELPHRIEFTCSEEAVKTLVPLLEELRHMGRIGATRTLRIENWSKEGSGRRSVFGFDGDGWDKIGDILVDGEKVE